MIRQRIILPHFDDWEIYAYFAVSKYMTDEIMEKLWEIGCDGDTALQAYRNLASCELNTGLCYSNYRQRKSVMVVALTTSAAEFLNSLHHELCHLTSHIGKVFDLDPTGEDIAYLSGEISREMYPKIGHLLCEECRSASCSH